MVLRSLIGTGLVAVALGFAWIGYLAIGSWEATTESTWVGIVLVTGAVISVGCVLASFRKGASPNLLAGAAVATALAFAIAVLIE